MNLISKLRARFSGNRVAITLVELTLVLALAAIVVFVAVRAYSNAQENNRVQQLSSEVGQVRSVIESLYQGQPDFTGLAASSIGASLPSSLYNTTAQTISNPFNGTIAVAPGTDTGTYTIAASNLPADACQRIAVMDMGRSVKKVTINSTDAAAVPATPAEGSTNCQGGDSVTWTFQ